MSTTELTLQDRRSASLATTEDLPADPLMALMNRFAANDNLSAEKAKALLDIYIEGQRRMQLMQDERAFADAMAEFKKNPPQIVKNRTAKVKGVAKGSGREYEYEYNYADLDAYCSEAMPKLATFGVTWSFPFTEKDGKIEVSCILRYGLYQHAPTTLSAAPEGGNNAIQAKGVAVAYLERYTFAGATGLTAAMPDKDGITPASVTPNPVSEEDEAKLQEWADALKQCDTLPMLKNIFADAYKFAGRIGSKQKDKIRAIYEECKARLQ